MNFSLQDRYLSITKLLTVPLLLAFSAYFYFQNSLHTVSLDLANSGSVAGTQDVRTPKLASVFPIIPGAIIVSSDESNKTKSLTLEIHETEQVIKKFYKDYLLIQGWEQVNSKLYRKGNLDLTVVVEGDIILLNLKTVE